MRLSSLTFHANLDYVKATTDMISHLYLINLIWWYCKQNEMIVVYDFMGRGTLSDHLYNTDNPPLSWKQRLQICIGAARGLHYLHTGGKHTIIHRNVKTTNILLDDKWVAKVSDFGLSRIGPTDTDKSHVSTHVKGSFGYIDPEYYKRFRLTEKSDVYSFGVVLFEILCGRPALIHSAETQQVSLSNWVKHCDRNGTIAEIVEPALKKKIAPECLKKFCEIGMSCLLEDGTQRPCMKDVVAMLEFTLRLQESAEQTAIEKGEEISEDSFSTTNLNVTTTTNSTSEGNGYSNNTVLSWTPFLEIMDGSTAALTQSIKRRPLTGIIKNKRWWDYVLRLDFAIMKENQLYKVLYIYTNI
ncbi:receptor-like protein kinase FERONIA [Vigna unguiculata]|uniref:receptor-like protein kinase FERONIA n=1 Tax=Vigna unguiculata TaxID=3917 RepID=UPI001016FC5F|nr:receptor-like protein kinase FERONIA [Vigna unguiculata]